MASSTTPDPAGRSSRRPVPDPLVMTPEEKAICEWEARHDVAARGSRATPGAIQLYLAESRSRERCEEASRPRPHPEAHHAVPGPRPVPPHTEELLFRLAPPEHRPRRSRGTPR
jgi:hypothetical protein